MNGSSGMDLVLCAMEAGSGRVRFGPRLSYTLPVAELSDLEAAKRIAVREAEPVKRLETSGGLICLCGLLGHDGRAGLVDPHLAG